MGRYASSGDTIDYTPGSNTTAGTVVVQGDLIGVARVYIPANTLGALAVEGVFDFPKPGATAYTVGTIVYWDDTNDRVTTTASGNKLLGKVVRAAASADTFVRVKMTQ